MKKKADHKARTIKLYENDGWMVANVESKNLGVLGACTCKNAKPEGVMRVRFFGTTDLWGFADLLAIRDGEIALVQYTSGDNHAARVKKILASEKAHEARKHRAQVHVVSWRKPAGKARYVPRVQIMGGAA